MKISEHEKQIRKEEFTHGFDEAQIQFRFQHDEMIQHTLADIFDRQQEWHDEQYIEAFALGCTTGIQDECEYQVSAQASQPSITTQTDPITTSSISIQTHSHITPPSSSATISTQTESKSLIPTTTLPKSLSVSILEPPKPATSSF